jgi:TP901 family phage tail tape measure protein
MLSLSTRIPMSAEGLARIAAAAGQAGIAESELLRFTEDAAKMSVAFDISAEEAGSAMTGLRTNFKLNQDGVISLGDSFNHLANNMDVTAGELVNYSNRVGGTASIYGFTGQQVGALGAAFVAMKTPAEVGARATNSLLMKLGNAGDAGGKAEDAFERLGFSGKGMADMFKKDAQGAMLAFLEAVKRSDDPMRELNAIMGEGFADETAKLVNGLDEYKKALGLIGDEAAYAGSMEAEYAARSKTTANSLELMKNAGARLGIILGSAVLPGVTAVADAVVAFLEPVAWLASACPLLTKLVFGAVAAFAAFKLVALGGAYASTLFSDMWIKGKNVLNLLKPSAIQTTLALVRQNIAATALSVKTKALALAQAAQNAAMAVARSHYVVATAAAIRHGAISTALAVKTRAMAVAQWLLNTAMLANPIVWIVLAVAALVAGFVLLYNKCETFRKVVNTVCSAVAGYFSFVWKVAKAIWGGIYSAITSPIETAKAAWSGITGFFGGLWDGIVEAAKAPFDWIAGKFEWVTNTWGKVKGFFSGIFGDDEEKQPIENPTNDPYIAYANNAVPTVAVAPSVAAPGSATAPVVASVTAPVPISAALPTERPVSAPAPSGSATSQARPAAPVGTGGAQSLPERAATPGANIQPQINFDITMNGVPSKDIGQVLVDGIKARESDLTAYFEKLLERIAANQRRVTYG